MKTTTIIICLALTVIFAQLSHAGELDGDLEGITNYLKEINRFHEIVDKNGMLSEDMPAIDPEAYKSNTMWADCIAWNTIQYGKYGAVRSLYNVNDIEWALETAVKYFEDDLDIVKMSIAITEGELGKREEFLQEVKENIKKIKDILEALR